jgi:hypothetical protein
VRLHAADDVIDVFAPAAQVRIVDRVERGGEASRCIFSAALAR